MNPKPSRLHSAAFSLLAIAFAWPTIAGGHRLEIAIATCQVETVKSLLDAGADPNEKDSRGEPVIRWLASNTKCDDKSALATAKLLVQHGAAFQSGVKGPSLLVNLAHRGLPNTIEFLCQKGGAGDPTQALRAIARRGDLASVRVLLSAGADPLQGNGLSSSLFDATAENKRESVKEILKFIKNKQAPKVLAAFEMAQKNGNQELAQIFIGAGVKPKPVAVAREPLCKRSPLTADQAHLLEQLALSRIGCQFVQECGDLLLVDCDSAADGPAYYVNQKTVEILATCGGACMKGCTGCPPKEWKCQCKL